MDTKYFRQQHKRKMFQCLCRGKYSVQSEVPESHPNIFQTTEQYKINQNRMENTKPQTYHANPEIGNEFSEQSDKHGNVIHS